MYKVKDPYQGSILTLNLMELEQARKIRFSFGEVVAIIIPFVAIALIFLGDFFLALISLHIAPMSAAEIFAILRQNRYDRN